MGVIVSRCPFVAECEQHDDLGSGGDQLAGPAMHEFGVAALEQVAHEEHDAVTGPIDELLAVSQGIGDVGATAELHTEQDLDRIVQERGEVGDAPCRMR